MEKNTELRLARMEAVCEHLRAQMMDVLQREYQNAIDRQDEASAAALARKIRNQLLDRSDKQCALDKNLPPVPDGNDFSDWAEWLRAFANIAASEWAIYRQSLRDLPTQEGFPFQVIFPTSPDALQEEGELVE